MLVAAVVDQTWVHLPLVELGAVVKPIHLEQKALMELQIQAAAQVVDLVLLEVVVLVALALSLFVMQILMRRRHQQQAHQQLQLLAATVFINGLDQGVSHSDGTLCKD
jgi:hypothetical protein